MCVDHTSLHINELKPECVQLRIAVHLHAVQGCTVHIVDETVDRGVTHHHPANDVSFAIDAQGQERFGIYFNFGG